MAWAQRGATGPYLEGVAELVAVSKDKVDKAAVALAVGANDARKLLDPEEWKGEMLKKKRGSRRGGACCHGLRQPHSRVEVGRVVKEDDKGDALLRQLLAVLKGDLAHQRAVGWKAAGAKGSGERLEREPARERRRPGAGAARTAVTGAVLSFSHPFHEHL